MEKSLKVIITSDGSPTLYLEHLDETYHSRHGALQESQHVFIDKGLDEIVPSKKSLNILEVGLGTGLNSWLTWDYARQHGLQLHYTGVEAFPLLPEVTEEIIAAFEKIKTTPDLELLKEIHNTPWNENRELDKHFSLLKIGNQIQQVELSLGSIDLIYYDAFGPKSQAEMWEHEIFTNILPAIKPGGILVSYCAQGQFRRNLKSLGMEVETVEGPPGKREMTRATKPEL